MGCKHIQIIMTSDTGWARAQPPGQPVTAQPAPCQNPTYALRMWQVGVGTHRRRAQQQDAIRHAHGQAAAALGALQQHRPSQSHLCGHHTTAVVYAFPDADWLPTKLPRAYIFSAHTSRSITSTSVIHGRCSMADRSQPPHCLLHVQLTVCSNHDFREQTARRDTMQGTPPG